MPEAFEALMELRRQLRRLLEPDFAVEPALTPRTFTPPLDVVALPNGWAITIELPGLRREEISVELRGKVLTIAGERRAEQPEAGQQTYRRERPSGRFQRSLALPESDGHEITAKLKNGVLTIYVLQAEQNAASAQTNPEEAASGNEGLK